MKQVLIIEDDLDYRKMLKYAFEEAGYAVLEASNGDEGCRLYRQHQCPVVITDIFMPEKEGLETIRELRDTYPTLKIIAISGGGSRSIYAGAAGAEIALEAAQGLGATRVLTKPFELPHLIAMVEELSASV